RNVGELHAWAYRISLAEWERFDEYRYRDDGDAGLVRHFARALRAGAAATWQLPVPAHPLDYKEQQWATVGPALSAGYYLLIVSTQATSPAINGPGVATAYAALGASGLSAVSRSLPATGVPQLLVLDRQSGQPLSGVSAQATFGRYVPNGKNSIRTGTVRKTDAAGKVELEAAAKFDNNAHSEKLIRPVVWRGTDTLVVGSARYFNYERDNVSEVRSETRTFLFTDRAIYRPGQTLYFKGIVLERRANDTRLLTRQAQTVRLTDPNGQTVQTLEFTTSDFGSFNGSLVLPTGLLNGEFQLQTPSGSLAVSVEDYKRPTFLVQLDSVPGRPQLGQPLTVRGRAHAYAGPATDGATVQYRVTRRALWPLFDYGFRGGRIGYPGSRATTEIAHGTTTTDAEGRFAITFTPPLAPAQPGQFGWQPGFLFEVTADVT
ncbi:MAG: hypothetical protein EOO59_15715, partial [Hymenobacter sp.]